MSIVATNEIQQSNCLPRTDTPLTPERLVDTIDKIKQLREQGQNIALIIGRQTKEPLPPAQKGWTWVSLDLFGPESENDRLHLRMDVNNSKEMGKIQALFNRVVVDPSTVKVFDSIWTTLKSLMVKAPESELIVEAFSGIAKDADGNQPAVYPRQATIALPNGQDFENHKELYYSKMQAHLNFYFRHIELRNDEFPYREGLRAVHEPYYVLRDRKL